MPQRLGYITAIQNIHPFDSIEASDIEETLAWLRTAPTIHKPANMQQHLGVIIVVLSQDRKKTFVLNHKKAQLWLPPGGHVDDGLSFREAADMEMKEELNSEALFIADAPFFLTKTLTQGMNPGHIDVTAWFLVEGNIEKEYHVLEKEASEAKWINLEEFSTMSESSHLPRAYQKIKLFLK